LASLMLPPNLRAETNKDTKSTQAPAVDVCDRTEVEHDVSRLLNKSFTTCAETLTLRERE